MSINTGASIFIAGCKLKERLHHGIECIAGVVCNLNLKKCLIMVKIFHLYILSCEGCMELPGLRPPTSVGRTSDVSRQTETAYPDGICAPKAAGVASALQKAKCAASGHAEAQGAAGRWPAFPPLLQEQAGLASLVGGGRHACGHGNHDAGCAV